MPPHRIAQEISNPNVLSLPPSLSLYHWVVLFFQIILCDRSHTKCLFYKYYVIRQKRNKFSYNIPQSFAKEDEILVELLSQYQSRLWSHSFEIMIDTLPKAAHWYT